MWFVTQEVLRDSQDLDQNQYRDSCRDETIRIQIGGEQQETPAREKIELDIEVGDMIVVTSGAWEGTTSAVTAINESKTDSNY